MRLRFLSRQAEVSRLKLLPPPHLSGDKALALYRRHPAADTDANSVFHDQDIGHLPFEAATVQSGKSKSGEFPLAEKLNRPFGLQAYSLRR